MSQLTFRPINPEEKSQVISLIDRVIGSLDNPEFFIPYEDWELEKLFDQDYAPLNGAFDDDQLVGMSQLYVQQDMLAEYIDLLELQGKKVCELGGALVLPAYRNRGIMTALLKKQVELAKEKGFEVVISMAHPENIASNRALQKVGLKLVKETEVNGGFVRKIYLMEP